MSESLLGGTVASFAIWVWAEAEINELSRDEILIRVPILLLKSCSRAAQFGRIAKNLDKLIFNTRTPSMIPINTISKMMH
jgi:hypothetical protein